MSEPAAVPTTVLKHPPFLFYWTARTAASVAWQIQAVAVGWQMYALTGSAFDLGLVGLAEFVPLIAFMLAVGPLADRYERRRIMQTFQALEMLCAAGLAWATFTGHVSKEVILILVFLLGTGRAFEAPTSSTVLPAIVPTALFPKAVATNSSATQIATIVGPAVGGLLYALSPTLVYVVCASCYLLSISLLAMIRIQIRSKTRAPLTLDSIFAGFRYIRFNRIVLGVMSLDLFAVLLGGAVALLPIYASDVFNVGAEGLGLLRAAPAAGAIITIVIMSRWSISSHVGKVLLSSVAIFGLATVVFAVSTSFWLTMLALAITGAADSAGVIVRMTLVQLETTDEMRGRVSAVNSVFIGTSNALGAFRAGAMAAWLGAMPAVLIGGIGSIAVAALWMRWFPELYRVQAFPPQRVSDEAAELAPKEASASV